MSIAITSMVWQRSKAKGPARLVLLALADHADEEGRAWPSAARLARYTLMDVRNVHRALARLVKEGEIVAAGKGPRGVIIYEIRPGGGVSEPMAKPPEVEPTHLGRNRQMAKSSCDDFGIEPLAKSSGAPLAKSSDKPSIEPSLEPSRAAAAECRQAVDEWNVLAGELDLSRVQRLTTTRQSKLTARLKDAGGIDGWQAALRKIRNTPGLGGQNDRGWHCDFDWLVSESNFTKVMEGKYDDWGTIPASGACRVGSSSRRRANHDAVFAGLVEAARRAGNDR